MAALSTPWTSWLSLQMHPAPQEENRSAASPSSSYASAQHLPSQTDLGQELSGSPLAVDGNMGDQVSCQGCWGSEARLLIADYNEPCSS